jgi:cell division protein FtsI/penicillin-binding protein 2
MIGSTIKNREAELVLFRSRALVAGMAIVIAFTILAGRMLYLQVIKRSYYHTLAEANRISILPVVPNRGLILDRNNEVLAANYSAYTLEVTPSLVKSLDKTLDELMPIVDIQARDRRRFKRLLEESKNPQPPQRRGSRAFRGQPLSLSRLRDPRAPVSQLSLWRDRLACAGLYQPHQRCRRQAHRGRRSHRQLPGYRPHRQARHRGQL